MVHAGDHHLGQASLSSSPTSVWPGDLVGRLEQQDVGAVTVGERRGSYRPVWHLQGQLQAHQAESGAGIADFVEQRVLDLSRAAVSAWRPFPCGAHVRGIENYFRDVGRLDAGSSSGTFRSHPALPSGSPLRRHSGLPRCECVERLRLSRHRRVHWKCVAPD